MCVQLQRACSSQPTAEEMTARELCEIDGIGASVATALALTQALGGSRHASRASLSAWAAQDGGATLRAFLLTRYPVGLPYSAGLHSCHQCIFD